MDVPDFCQVSGLWISRIFPDFSEFLQMSVVSGIQGYNGVLRGKKVLLPMEVPSGFRNPVVIIVLMVSLIFSTSSRGQYYAVYAYLRSQAVVRLFSIVQVHRLPATNRVTALFHPVTQIVRSKKSPRPFTTLGLHTRSDGVVPVTLELNGISRPVFQHGIQSNPPVLTEYIQHGLYSQVFKSDACIPSLRSERENILSMSGISFDIDGSYPGGAPDSMNLLGLHNEDYPYVDINMAVNQLNPEDMLQSQRLLLYPRDQQERTLSTELQYEEAHLMAYFTNQGDIDNFTLYYIPGFQSFMGILEGVYYIIMTPIHVFGLLTRW